MDWYRRYHGTCRDPKMEKAARRASVPRPYVIAAWDAVLEHASARVDRGCVEGLDPEEIAIAIGCDEDEAQRILKSFQDLGMISEDRVAAWENRQKTWDDPALRMRAHRERRKNRTDQQPATQPLRNADVNVTHRTEQNRTEQNNRSADADAVPPADADGDDDQPSASSKNGRTYAFEGKVVRLTTAKLRQWEQEFQHIDVRARLTVRDGWLTTQSDRDRAKWYETTLLYLANENDKAKGQANKPPTPPPRTDRDERGRPGSYLSSLPG